jgi:hypothetical protein
MSSGLEGSRERMSSGLEEPRERMPPVAGQWMESRERMCLRERMLFSLFLFLSLSASHSHSSVCRTLDCVSSASFHQISETLTLERDERSKKSPQLADLLRFLPPSRQGFCAHRIGLDMES